MITAPESQAQDSEFDRLLRLYRRQNAEYDNLKRRYERELNEADGVATPAPTPPVPIKARGPKSFE